MHFFFFNQHLTNKKNVIAADYNLSSVYTTYCVALSGNRTSSVKGSPFRWGALLNIHSDSPVHSSGLQLNFFCFLAHERHDAHGISAFFAITVVCLRTDKSLMKGQSR